MNRQRIILAGPPGAGKSTVARALGAQRGQAVIDLDDAIAAATKRRVADIIREDGEAAFRGIEASVLESLETLPGEAEIIALGGGTLTTPRGRTAARAAGRVFALSAEEAVLRARLAESGGDRPLLSDPSQLAELLRTRRKTYAAVDRTIPAAGAVSEVAARVEAAGSGLELIHARVGEARSRVLVGDTLSEAAAGAIAALAPSRPVLAIIDRGVPAAISGAYLSAIRAVHDGGVVELAVPGGEQVKTWSSLGGVLEHALAHGCGRQSAVIAIGGGATCDLGALAASLLGRGAPLVLVPSTLLAQVDASIGGKAAVNMGAGRNLVGAFHAATDVIVDRAMLHSLPDGERASGLAELAKIALIADRALFLELAARGPSLPEAPQIARGIAHKAAIVARDPFERGERKVLNLGHTLGHAIEFASDFSWRHGEAVAVGIAAVCRMSAQRGWMSGELSTQIVRALGRIGLPTSAPRDLLERSAACLKADKKADATGIDLVAVHEIGKVSLKRLSSDELIDLVRCGAEEVHESE